MPTVLVTGASRGLGLELTRQYAADDWQVIACARTPARAAALGGLAEHYPGRVEIQTLDVTGFGDIDGLARRLEGCAIDVLINCAGGMDRGGTRAAFGKIDYEDMARLFHLNALAPLKMAEAFVRQVAASEGKKIVNISTIMASITRNRLGVGGFYAYRTSKAALNAITVNLANDLGRKHGIVVAALHPGWVRTDMGGPRGELDAATSVTGMRQVIAGLTQERSGHFWSYDGSELPW